MKLKKLTAALMSLMMLGNVAAIPALANGDEPVEKKTYSYVALGDSIAAGYRLTDGGTRDPLGTMVLTEDLIADPVKEAYPAVFGTYLDELGEKAGYDEVSTKNLATTAYRASDVSQTILQDGYKDELMEYFLDNYYQEVSSDALAGYHDIFNKYIPDADLISIHLGANDVTMAEADSLLSENNIILHAIGIAYAYKLAGYDIKTALGLGMQYFEENKESVTYETFAEAAAFFNGAIRGLDQHIENAAKNVAGVVDAVRTINADADIALIGLYNPFGNSLEYNGKSYDIRTIVTDIFEQSAAKLSGEVPDTEEEEEAEELPENGLDGAVEDYREHVAELQQAIKGNADAAHETLSALMSVIAAEVSYPIQYMTAGKTLDPYIKKLNANIKAVAADKGAIYVDIYDIKNENNSDVHPDAENHARIAELMNDSLEGLVTARMKGEPYVTEAPVITAAPVTEFTMTEGDVRKGFVPEGTACVSSDKSIAWVDDEGDLNAMKPGKVTITVPSENGSDIVYTVTVEDYSDGSEVAGNLKILARYNDSMQFYDGHVYLMFTSYLDDVDVTVNDLYGGYEISDRYYKEIGEDIANGSNHTDKDADKYFTFNKDLKTVTLDRGEIVTIGMYRDFDLTVPQAALGSIQNSSVWSKLSNTVKTFLIENIFNIFDDKKISTDKALAQMQEAFAEIGGDHTKLLDGVVDGGVCFNRELYNQKLEWDQYENVTYDMDITENQLKMLMMYLGGNNGKFSILKNSCATVALRAWNAAVGTRNGEDTAYRLDATGEGIFSIIDAPKSVRDGIIKNLPGYYLNNSENVAEPGAGFEDETGAVYVSAPKKVESVEKDNEQKLSISVINADAVNAETKVYTKISGEKADLGSNAAVSKETAVYVSSKLDPTEYDHVLGDITLDGVSVMDDVHYDADEDAYVFNMPEKNASLQILYKEASVAVKDANIIQVSVGDSFDAADYAELTGLKGMSADKLVWKTVSDDGKVLEKAGNAVKAVKEGSAVMWICAAGNENIGVPITVEVYESTADMAKIAYTVKGGEAVITSKYGEEDKAIPFSGYLVKKGSVLTVAPAQTDNAVISGITCNGEVIEPDEDITVNEDAEISISLAPAVIEGMPETVKLAAKGDTYQLNASIRYSGLYRFNPVYDQSVRYMSSDPIVEVDENGLITVADDVPEEGKAVYVTAYAGSGNDKVFARTKVVLGDYKGAKVVGTLTLHARRSAATEIIPHAATTFTSYEDADLNISYYNYYKPTEKYAALMEDYRDHPEKYTSDPALFNDDELDLEDRESYFEVIHNGDYSDPATVSLKAGESVSLSNYPYNTTNLKAVLGALEGSTAAKNSAEAQEFIKQLRLYLADEEIDGPAAFDSMLGTIKYMYGFRAAMGYNPAEGHTDGGTVVNREMYNQFVANNQQLPNNYFTVEITADELAMMQACLSDPDTNYYSVFNSNCATEAVNIWNAALADRPEYQITSAAYTGLTMDPNSLYFDLGKMMLDSRLGGICGTNFYPRTVAYAKETPTETPAATAEPTATPTPTARPSGSRSSGGGGGGGSHSGTAIVGIGATGVDSSVLSGGTVVSGGNVLKDSTAVSSANSFVDIDTVQWAIPAINTLAGNGIVNGTTSTNFEPLGSVTRAQFAKMVCGAFGIGSVSPAAARFTDVTPADWFYGYVEAAAANGIVKGVSDTEFDPNSLITREQMAVMLYRAVTHNNVELISGAPAAFTDAASISGYAVDPVNALSSAGVINGKDDGSFAPRETATRAQAAAIIYQYLMSLAK